MGPRLHRRQFVIANAPFRAPEGWEIRPLEGGATLHHCPELPVATARDREGVEHVVLGIALEAAPEAAPPLEGIAAAPTSAVAALGYDWAGRWARVAQGRIAGDAANLLGLFHMRDADGALLISSSLALLAEAVPSAPIHARKLGRHGIGWHPTPGTKIEGARKLLPDQSLDLATGAVARAPKSRLGEIPQMSAEEAGARLLDCMAAAWRAAARAFDPLTVTLTAGLDSRTVLAAGLHAGVKPDAMTLAHPHIAAAEARLPREICARLGLRHRSIPHGRRSRARLGLYDAHTLGDIADGDRDYFSRAMLDPFAAGSALMRGSCFEIGRDHYYAAFAGMDWAALAEDHWPLIRRFKDFGSLRLEHAQMAPWFAWRAEHPEPFDWKDCFYRDQRMCGWLAANEQSLDLLDARSINPASSARIFDLLLAVPPETRKAGLVQHAAIAAADLGLDAFPINPDIDARAERLRKTAMIWLDRGLRESLNALRKWERRG